jgi:hypothetical protein
MGVPSMKGLLLITKDTFGIVGQRVAVRTKTVSITKFSNLQSVVDLLRTIDSTAVQLSLLAREAPAVAHAQVKMTAVHIDGYHGT